MDVKRNRSLKKSLDKNSMSFSNSKKRPSSAKKPKLKESANNHSAMHSFAEAKKKKTSALTKKKIEDIKTPELIIRANYKDKKLSVPLTKVDKRGLYEIINPYIYRFERQILRNPSFSSSQVENWKTIGQGDILKDYYFQTGKSLQIFKDQVLEIEPIWSKSVKEPVRLQDFQIIKCIGTGGFSRVFLTRYLPNGKFYALKLMEKEGLIESGKECVVTNERDIMAELDHPQILKLQFAFETKHFVALALQYCPGGQLFYYLRKVRRMTEDEARFCFIEILMGIQYLHSKKIIYRDIKPENIMIDMNGNLKIADFGLSKKGARPSEFAYTFCGSPEYMAPEMLSKEGHSYSVDYYCLGALLYQLVTGSPPFYSRDVDKIYYCIQNQQIDFPAHVELSPEIKMLLEGLLIKDPKRRLGSLGGIREILGHPWVRKIKPSDIENRSVETPVKVDLMAFNINEQEIDEAQGDFSSRFLDQDGNFDQIFEDFYFNRNSSFNVCQEALPSVKSDSTKENRSLNPKSRAPCDNDRHHYKSSNSKDRKSGYALNFNNQEGSQKMSKGFSEKRSYKESKKFPRTNSHTKIDLVVKGRARNDKSLVGKEKKYRKEKVLSPKGFKGNKSGLKRIKSSAFLHEKILVKPKVY